LDLVHQAIDDYVCLSYQDAEDLVKKYDVFKAIRLYNASYDNFIADDDDKKNYNSLAYMIIENIFLDKYPEFIDLKIECVEDSEDDE
jgi:hypothetical protein